MHMRLFIAIDCNSEKEYFTQLQGQLPKEAAKLSATSDFHLTLKFLGEVMPDKVEKIKEALQSIVFSPFSFSLHSVGVFPVEKSPRVVWVGIEPQEPSRELQESVEKALHGLFEKEKRFEPHITLARVKSIEQDKIRDFIAAMKSCSVEKKEFSVSRLHLVKSTPASHGSVYEHILSVEGKQ